jgi:hypothetical protein
MAVIADGVVVRYGVPDALVDDLAGRVWTARVERADVAAFSERHRVLSTQLHAGVTNVRVQADAAPGADFASAVPELEDVYFSALAEHAGVEPAESRAA